MENKIAVVAVVAVVAGGAGGVGEGIGKYRHSGARIDFGSDENQRPFKTWSWQTRLVFPRRNWRLYYWPFEKGETQ